MTRDVTDFPNLDGIFGGKIPIKIPKNAFIT